MNNLLRGTLPTLADLATQVAALSNPPPPGARGAPPLAKIPGLSAQAIAGYQLTALAEAARALVDKEAGQRATADFTPCQMSTAALAAAGLYKPLALGNGVQGQTIALKAGDPYTVPVIGGLAPLSSVVSGSDPAEFRPTADITMQGVALLKVTVAKQEKGVDHTYHITVYDSAGANRWFDVVVPKGP